MTSEKALYILLYGSNNNVSYKDFIKARDKIEKALEILEIIKRKFVITTNFISFIVYDNDEEYIKIIEWIINDANKNMSRNIKLMLNSLYGVMLNDNKE